MQVFVADAPLCCRFAAALRSLSCQSCCRHLCHPHHLCYCTAAVTCGKFPELRASYGMQPHKPRQAKKECKPRRRPALTASIHQKRFYCSAPTKRNHNSHLYLHLIGVSCGGGVPICPRQSARQMCVTHQRCVTRQKCVTRKFWSLVRVNIFIMFHIDIASVTIPCHLTHCTLYFGSEDQHCPLDIDLWCPRIICFLSCDKVQS